MPIGIVNDDDYLAELQSLLRSNKKEKDEDKEDDKRESEPPQIKDIQRGRGNNPEVPATLRAVLGTTAIEDGNKNGEALAREFGISKQSVHAYKNGATSEATYKEPNKELAEKVNGTRLKISSRASSRLLEALKHITPEKLADAKLRDIASTAQAMSAVIRNIEPQSQPGNNQNVNFVFFAPKLRPESEYDVITVNE